MSADNLTLKLKDGRTLSYAVYGDPAGQPIIGFHGMPGSRLVMRIAEQAALSNGVRIIAPERPGYGLSDPQPRGTLLGYVDDVVALADALGLAQFAVMGVSGGGPYALACAYKLPDRLTATAVVSGIGPLSLPGSTRDMMQMNRLMFTLGRLSPALVGILLPLMLKSSLPSMEKQVQNGTSPTPDLSPAVFAIMTTDQREAIHTGGKGIVFDMKMLWRDWGFRFEDIRVRVYVWHGDADNLAPTSLARYIAAHVPNCQAVFYPGEGHTDPLVKHMDEIIPGIVASQTMTSVQ